MKNSLQKQVQTILTGTGIAINGSNPWDIRVHDERFFARVLAQGSLGFGESYMEGWWDCDALDELVDRLMRFDIRSKLRPNLSLMKNAVHARLLNRQNKKR